MLTNVGYVGIIVKDVAEATAFYRDTLGFTLEGAAPTMATIPSSTTPNTTPSAKATA